MHKTFFFIILLSLFAGFLWQIGLNLQTYKVGTYLYKDSIILESPLPQEFIETPLAIKGRARGDWFSDGNFPVILTNWNGKILAEGYAITQSNWKTKNFVSFETVLKFTKPEQTKSFDKKGFLIFKKNNSSDILESDNLLKMPIYFK